ncbi:MAG: SDR family NAD(P)-dependent oxidoreductase [Propionibacteriaceae bacterium]
MTGRLTGKVALVTGAASGIGRAVALRFAAEGATVAFADRDLAGAEAAARSAGGPGGRAIRLDITDEESVRAGFAELADAGLQLDVVVANAGVQLFGRDAAAGALDLAVWERTLRVNLTGTFLTLKHAVLAMSGTGGSIIVTGSPTGVTGGGTGFTAYSASKAGVHGLVRVVAADYAGRGIRVNAVIPGFTETPLVRDISTDADRRQQLLDTIPLGRAGRPDDVDGIMVYLASDESTYATGALFTVDGGATAV